MRIQSVILAWMVLACVPQALGHDPWVLADPPRPAPGESFQVEVGSGHAFPKSAVAVRENLLKEVVCVDEQGQSHPVSMRREANQWAGSTTMPEAGSLLLRAVLVQPRREAPVFEMTAIVLPASGGEGRATYALGEGFEIVPDRLISKLRLGDAVGLRVQLDGVPLSARIEVHPEDGRPLHLSATEKAPGELLLSRPGRYLLVSRQGGRGGSLVFDVPAAVSQVVGREGDPSVPRQARDLAASVGMTDCGIEDVPFPPPRRFPEEGLP